MLLYLRYTFLHCCLIPWALSSFRSVVIWTPRYFWAGTHFSLSPDSLRHSTTSNLSSFGLTNMHRVFFALYRGQNCHNILVRPVKRALTVQSVLEHQLTWGDSYRCHPALASFSVLFSLIIYTLQNNGDKIPPCLTPLDVMKVVLKHFRHLTMNSCVQYHGIRNEQE